MLWCGGPRKRKKKKPAPPFLNSQQPTGLGQLFLLFFSSSSSSYTMSVFTREKPSKSPPSPCPNHLLSPPLCPGPDTYKGAGWKLQGRTKGPKRNCSRSQPVKQQSAPVLGFSCKSHVGISLACVLLYASCFNYVLQNRIQVTVQVYSFGDNFRWLGTKMDILIKKEEEDNITNKYSI